jgi:hypothetical protein
LQISGHYGIWEGFIKVMKSNSRKGKSHNIGMKIPEIGSENTIKIAIIDSES